MGVIGGPTGSFLCVDTGPDLVSPQVEPVNRPTVGALREIEGWIWRAAVMQRGGV